MCLDKNATITFGNDNDLKSGKGISNSDYYVLNERVRKVNQREIARAYMEKSYFIHATREFINDCFIMIMARFLWKDADLSVFNG